MSVQKTVRICLLNTSYIVRVRDEYTCELNMSSIVCVRDEYTCDVIIKKLVCIFSFLRGITA